MFVSVAISTDDDYLIVGVKRLNMYEIRDCTKLGSMVNIDCSVPKDRQTDRQADRQTGGQTYTQTDMQAVRRTGRRTVRHNKR